MVTTTKFATRPHSQRKEKPHCSLGAVRGEYNKALERKQSPGKENIDTPALQSSLSHGGNKCRNSFPKRSRFPKEKNKQSKRATSCLPQVKSKGNKIHLPKTEWIKAILAREERRKIKGILSSLEEIRGRYNLSTLVESENTHPSPTKQREKAIEMERGFNRGLTDAKGHTIENPGFQ